MRREHHGIGLDAPESDPSNLVRGQRPGHRRMRKRRQPPAGEQAARAEQRQHSAKLSAVRLIRESDRLEAVGPLEHLEPSRVVVDERLRMSRDVRLPTAVRPRIDAADAGAVARRSGGVPADKL